MAGAGAEIGSLTASERALYLDASGMLDYNSNEFQHWLASENLKRHVDERNLDFAWRVFARIRQLYTYHYDSNQDRNVSKLCQTNQTDCGGLSLMFASALRANQMPARTLFGRKTKSDSAPSNVRTGYGSDHVIAEFYEQGVGWIPVDMAAAISHKESDALRYFGSDPGDLVTLHIDPCFKVDTMLFGQEVIEYLQSPHFWFRGRGTTNDWSANVLWQVRKD